MRMALEFRSDDPGPIFVSQLGTLNSMMIQLILENFRTFQKCFMVLRMAYGCCQRMV
jgi:hypothetical protein